jgi:hypothetical protein
MDVVAAVVGGCTKRNVLEVPSELTADVVRRVVRTAETRPGRPFVENDEVAL